MKTKILALSVLALTLAACSDVGFEAKKTEFLASHSVLAGDTEAAFEVPIAGAPAEGGGPTAPQTGSPRTGGGTTLPTTGLPNSGGGTTVPTTGFPTGGGVKIPQIGWPTTGAPTGTNIPQATNPSGVPLPITGTKIPILNVCSMVYTTDEGTNVTTAKDIELVVKESGTGKEVCRLSSGIKTQILTAKTIDVGSCNLTGLSYELEIRDTAKTKSGLFYIVLEGRGSSKADLVTLSRKSTSDSWSVLDTSHDFGVEMHGNAKGLGVLFATNPKIQMNPDIKAEFCDDVTSPLVVNMTVPGERDFGIRLSSPWRGVDFDIQGENAKPMAHAKNRISWPRNDRYMFLALPKNGQVEGIDQLFGDNTRGPDGQSATDGFASLAKHDENGDLSIDRKDRVFSDLRLWSDTNRDGLSQPSELATLEEMGVESIDLVYDPNFFEQDRYGNQLKLKSVVKMRDESLRMIFDVWFAL